MLSLKQRSIGISCILKVLSVIFVLAMLSSVSPVMAIPEVNQPVWMKSFGAFKGWSVVQTVDGGYAIAGENATYKDRGYGDYAPLLIKTDSQGELQWAKTYGLSYGVSGIAYSVVQTKDLGYALCGQGSEGWVLKTDASGNAQWNKTFGSGLTCTAIQTSDESYLLAGYYYPDYANNNIPILLKTDKNGNLLWNKTFSSGPSWIRAVQEASDGGYVVAGTWEGDFWFAKTDIDGNLLLNLTYHYYDSWQNGPQTFNSIGRTADGGYILSGDDVGSAWLFKTNSNGDEEWHQSYVVGDSGYPTFVSAMETTNGGFIAAGSYNSLALLVRFDTSGAYQWNTTYGQGNSDIATSVIATKDGGYVVTGRLSNNVWLAKFASESAVPPDETTFPFSAAWVVVAVIIVAVAGVGLWVYFKKHKRQSAV